MNVLLKGSNTEVEVRAIEFNVPKENKISNLFKKDKGSIRFLATKDNYFPGMNEYVVIHDNKCYTFVETKVTGEDSTLNRLVVHGEIYLK